jgi:hypothetical protein
VRGLGSKVREDCAGIVAALHQASQFSTSSKPALRRGRRILDLGEAVVQWRHRLQERNEAAFASRLDDETIAVAMHDRVMSRQLELEGNADRLVAAVTKQFNRSTFHPSAPAYA